MPLDREHLIDSAIARVDEIRARHKPRDPEEEEKLEEEEKPETESPHGP
jgi:hypothetical protein